MSEGGDLGRAFDVGRLVRIGRIGGEPVTAQHELGRLRVGRGKRTGGGRCQADADGASNRDRAFHLTTPLLLARVFFDGMTLILRTSTRKPRTRACSPSDRCTPRKNSRPSSRRAAEEIDQQRSGIERWRHDVLVCDDTVKNDRPAHAPHPSLHAVRLLGRVAAAVELAKNASRRSAGQTSVTPLGSPLPAPPGPLHRAPSDPR